MKQILPTLFLYLSSCLSISLGSLSLTQIAATTQTADLNHPVASEPTDYIFLAKTQGDEELRGMYQKFALKHRKKLADSYHALLIEPFFKQLEQTNPSAVEKALFGKYAQEANRIISEHTTAQTALTWLKLKLLGQSYRAQFKRITRGQSSEKQMLIQELFRSIDHTFRKPFEQGALLSLVGLTGTTVAGAVIAHKYWKKNQPAPSTPVAEASPTPAETAPKSSPDLPNIPQLAIDVAGDKNGPARGN